MEKIPTAEEFFIGIVGENPDEFNGYIKECMIRFAQLHVEAALKEASERADLTDNGRFPYVDKDSILSSYPLSNIK